LPQRAKFTLDMAGFRGMPQASCMLPTFEIEPTEAQYGSVLWLHGLGADPHDFESVVPLLNAGRFRFVFPAAPVRAVTINGGMAMPAWYDILALADPPLREHEPDVRASEQQLRELIEREHERGVPYRRIVLAGFSQGGAMALHTALRFEQALGGVVVLSGYLLVPDAFEQERRPENQETPLLFCHGTHDPMVPLFLAEAAVDRLQHAQYAARLERYPMAHTLCVEEVAEIATFLDSC
jgi:phospholipase/carboxylesterase